MNRLTANAVGGGMVLPVKAVSIRYKSNDSLRTCMSWNGMI